MNIKNILFYIFFIGSFCYTHGQGLVSNFYTEYKRAIAEKIAYINTDSTLYKKAVNDGWFQQINIGLANASNNSSSLSHSRRSSSSSSGIGGATCDKMGAFCTSSVTYAAGVNTGIAQLGPAYGCLRTCPNPIWYYMKVKTAGDIHIVETNSNSRDVDFILWGPFSSTDVCSSLTSDKIIDCSYSTSATENINIPAAQAGEYYVLLVTNFSNSNTTISLTKTYNSTGETDCEILNAPSAPIATNATNIGSTSFTANWISTDNTTTAYRVDIASDITFSNIITQYNNLDVNNAISFLVNNLNAGKIYYYRVRAINTSSTSISSNIISVHLPISSTTKTAICRGDTYFFNGTSYKDAGIYTAHLTNSEGCDSIASLNLTINPTYNIIDSRMICASDLPYAYRDTLFKAGTQTNNYKFYRKTINGCDSIVQLALTVHPAYNLTDSRVICSNELPYAYRDTIFKAGTQTNNYKFYRKTINGCDSIVQLALTVHPAYNLTDSRVICSNELPYAYRDTIFKVGTQTNNYTFYRKTINGCDSIVQLALTVHPVYNLTDSRVILFK